MTSFLESLPVVSEEKLFLDGITSPQLHIPLHYHNELEIILILEGTGNYFIGNYVGIFSPGEVFLIGTNVTHAFEGLNEFGTKAISVQFKSDFLGKDFIYLSETSQIKILFERAKSGLKLNATTHQKILSIVQDLKSQTGFDRIISLCSCLNVMATEDDFQILSTIDSSNFQSEKRNKLEKIFEFTSNNFDRVITLEEIASIANMSIPTFCEYFKKSVQKTYIEFLNEFRISFACKLLLESELNICEIYLKCGYNTPANFNKQFLKYKKMSPSQYRKDCEAMNKIKSNISWAA